MAKSAIELLKDAETTPYVPATNSDPNLSSLTPKLTPKAGTVLRYKPGTKDGFQIPVYADGYGGEFDGQEIPTTTTANAGGGTDITPTRTLARDTFKETLGLLLGAKEADQPYVSKLYDLVSGFYKTGSTVDEALNLALYKAHNENAIPEFTKRFQGIFDLQDKLKAGKPVVVPTIAEFFATEAAMGEQLTQAGLGDLATQDFLGGIIGKGKSLVEVTNLVNDVFNNIDNAPAALKKDLQDNFPGIDRTSLAKAILTGDAGAKELTQKVKNISVFSAAKSQGVSIDMNAAADVAKMGYDYAGATTGFGEVKQLERANTLASFEGGLFSTGQAVGAVFGKNAAELERLRLLKETEVGRMSGSSGAARGAFSTGYMNKQAESGLY